LGFLASCVTVGLAQDQFPMTPDHKHAPKDFNPSHECVDCHGTIGPDDDPTTGGPDIIELLCLSCHGPAGISTRKAEVHMTRNGDYTCVDCHNPHYNPENWLGGQNLMMVGQIDYDVWPWIAKIQTPNSGLREVVFEVRGVDAGDPSLHSFADSDEDANGYYDGVCETCHTQTAHHRNDAEDLSHYTGSTCTTCHPHENGFTASGGDCTGCHSVPQDNGDGVPVGGRRAVVGEFPASDAHAHYGATLDSSSCVVCHDLSTHMNGYVELLDPDDGSIYSFVKPEYLFQDPDVSDFCAGCHDADGALRLADPLDPFGDGNVPPDVAQHFQGTLQWDEWYGDSCMGSEGTRRAVNSHHDISDADQAFSGAKIECIDCHGAHNAGATQPVADPFDTTQPWTGDSNGFCLACHEGGAGPSDPGFPPFVIKPDVALRGLDTCDYKQAPWFVEYTWTHSAHGPNSKRQWDGYSGGPSFELDCKDCHDPHGSYTPANPLGNPYMIRDFVDGTMYVDDGVPGNWFGPPWNTFGVAREVRVPINGLVVDWGSDTSLCKTCHSNWIDAMHWHTMCNACQICHSHGSVWAELDWENYDDDTPCP
jgi:hypothetical protein